MGTTVITYCPLNVLNLKHICITEKPSSLLFKPFIKKKKNKLCLLCFHGLKSFNVDQSR